MNNEVNNNLNQNQEVTPVVEQEVSTQVIEQPIVSAPVTNEVPKKEKKKLDKKTLIRIIAISIIVVGLAIYFILFHNWEPKEDPTDPKSVVNTYFTSLVKKDYTTAFKYVYLPDNSFVDEDDYFTFISNNKNFNNLSDNSIVEVTKVEKEQTTATYLLKLNNDKEYNIKLRMNSNGNWYILTDNLYLENWKVEIPGDSKLYIGKELVDKSLSKKENNHDIYTIPAIAPSSKDFKIVTNFGELSKKYDVAGSNSGDKITLELTEEKDIQEALNSIKELWNSMYKDYIDGKSKEDILKKYYDSNFKEEDLTKYFNNSFDKLTRKGNKNSIYTNVELESIIVNPNKKQIIEANDIIRIEFGYKIKFLEDFVYKDSTDLNRTMARYSSIQLRKTNNGYVINEITDEKLFNYLNYTTQEYK